MVGSIPGISIYDHVNTFLNSLKSLMYAITSSREWEAPTMMFSITLGVVNMLIVIVGEILDMFPSSKASRVGMGLWN